MFDARFAGFVAFYKLSRGVFKSILNKHLNKKPLFLCKICKKHSLRGLCPFTTYYIMCA